MELMIKKTKFRDKIFIILGTLLMAASINLVYDPMNMVTGGITGLAIVLKDIAFRLWEINIPVWMTNIVLNIPLFIFAYFMLDRKEIRNTLFASVMLTFFIYVIPIYQIFESDYLLAAVFGGAIGGAGIGFVLITGATTGGTDLFCMLIHKRKKYYSVPRMLIVVDSIVVLAGILVFSINISLYAVIAVYITAKVSDSILEGLKFAKMAYIISDKHKEIADKIIKDMDRGVTGIKSTGMYSDLEKKLILCVVSKKEIIRLIDIVNEIDPNSFMIISDVREVVGEGFIENYH